jgi:hypothetical protein
VANVNRQMAWMGAVVLALLLAGWARADEGRAVLETAVAAHGGLERFRSLRSWHIVADRKVEGADEPNETYEEYLLRDQNREKTMLVKRRASSLLVFIHDGENGFAVTDGTLRTDAAASTEAYYRAHGEYYLRSLPFKWLDPGMTVAYAGREKLGDREVDLLRIAAEEHVGVDWQDVWVAAIDSETHLLAEARLRHHRESETWSSPPESGIVEITYRYSDYRDVGGLSIPFRLEYFSGGRASGDNVVRTIEMNAPLAPALFTPGAHLAR